MKKLKNPEMKKQTEKKIKNNHQKTSKIPQGKVFEKIRKAVSLIPKGKVSTYGLIGKSAGVKDARIVGWAIWGNKNPRIPCHRVVNKNGFVAEKFSLGGWQEQKKRLKKEGIEFLGEKRIDLSDIYTFSKIDTTCN